MDFRELALSILTARVPKLQVVYLFGSQADGTATAESDIDLAFLADSKAMDSVVRWNLEQDIAIACNRDVHLIDLRSADEILRIEVITKGKVIHEADKDARDVFEMCVISDYGRLNERRRDFLEEFYK